MDKNNCGCDGGQDYSLKVANNGIAQLASGDSDLSGRSAVTVFTAAGMGSLIKSVTVKATMQVTKGMVRIFIANGGSTSLFREITIPTTPSLTSTATPPLVLPTFEFKMMADFKLQAGASILASTQNSEDFNVVVESLDWSYPSLVQTPPTPDLVSCCNFEQKTASTGIGTASTANINLDGTGAIVSIFKAASPPSSKGAFVKTITMKALQSTNLGMVRFYIDNGTKNYLIKEIMIPETIQSGFDPSYKQIIDLNYYLKAGYEIGVSTQIAQGFAFTVEAFDWAYPIS